MSLTKTYLQDRLTKLQNDKTLVHNDPRNKNTVKEDTIWLEIGQVERALKELESPQGEAKKYYEQRNNIKNTKAD